MVSVPREGEVHSLLQLRLSPSFLPTAEPSPSNVLLLSNVADAVKAKHLQKTFQKAVKISFQQSTEDG